MKLAHALSVAVCTLREAHTEEQRANWRNRLAALIDLLPSGSGFDSGTEFQEDQSNQAQLVFNTSFHHMNDHGMYVRWTNHCIKVRATFSGFEMRITGKNYRDILGYIGETFHEQLNQEAPEFVWVKGEAA